MLWAGGLWLPIRFEWYQKVGFIRRKARDPGAYRLGVDSGAVFIVASPRCLK